MHEGQDMNAPTFKTSNLGYWMYYKCSSRDVGSLFNAQRNKLFSEWSNLPQKQVFAEKLIFLWIPSSFFHHLTPGCSWHVLIRSCQDLIKVFQEMFVYQDLGKMFQVLHELTRSCMSWQGVSSFVSLGEFSAWNGLETYLVWHFSLGAFC